MKSRNVSDSAAFSTSAGGGGSIDCSSWRNGIDEMISVQGYSVSTPLLVATTDVALPPSWRMRTTGDSMSTLLPAASTLSRQTSHIIPGPYFGYWNSSIS